MIRDDRYKEAIRIISTIGFYPSISRLQGKMLIGYNRARKIFDDLVKDGYVRFSQSKMDYIRTDKE
jgi:hypothetical protein